MDNSFLENPIPSNFSAINEVVRHVRSKTGDDLATFNHGTMFFFVSHRPLALDVGYRKKRPDGSFQKKVSYVRIYAKFCPFTGKPLYEGVESK